MAALRSSLVCVLFACNGPDATDTGAPTDPCKPTGTPTLAVGEGLTGYVAVPTGGEVTLVHGPQGGVHLEIGLEATFLDTSDLATGRITGSIDGVELATSFPRLDFRCANDVGTQQSWDTLLIYPALPAELDGQSTVVTATVTDAAGREVSATNTFTIRDGG